MDREKIEKILENHITSVSLFHDKECGRITQEQIIFKAQFPELADKILTALGEEKYCECGHIFTPGKCIEVDKVAPPTCAKCHRVIRILDFTPRT